MKSKPSPPKPPNQTHSKGIHSGFNWIPLVDSRIGLPKLEGPWPYTEFELGL